jgi:NADPH-dependent 2,4-dienoyl-CoA reductase/sulfur reductase-like enzyme
MKHIEMVIIGAGPAGISAAIEAAKSGMKVTVLDENNKAGGRIFSQLNDGLKIVNGEVQGPDFKKGTNLLTEFLANSHHIDYQNNAQVIGIFPNKELAYHRNGRLFRIRYKGLIIATGAYERSVPFPGWTLPGVYTAGGTQSLIKMQGILPGKKFLLAGTGPLQLVLANQIIEAGGEVVAILEAGDTHSWFRTVRAIWGNWRLLAEGIGYLTRIKKAKVPILRNHLITECTGQERVETAKIAECDNQWRPIPATARSVEVDTICLGYGFIPSVDLSRLAGCEHRFEARLGGWVPERNTSMQTTIPHVYSVGDGSGVAGNVVAGLEGRIAGIDAAQSFGYLSRKSAELLQKPFFKTLRKLSRFRRYLDDISTPRPGLYELANEETLICRCEEINLGAIKEAIQEVKPKDINELKRVTRSGMGHCQHKMCGHVLQEIMAAQLRVSLSEIGALRPRPPIKPVPLGVFEDKEML